MESSETKKKRNRTGTYTKTAEGVALIKLALEKTGEWMSTKDIMAHTGYSKSQITHYVKHLHEWDGILIKRISRPTGGFGWQFRSSPDTAVKIVAEVNITEQPALINEDEITYAPGEKIVLDGKTYFRADAHRREIGKIVNINLNKAKTRIRELEGQLQAARADFADAAINILHGPTLAATRVEFVHWEDRGQQWLAKILVRIPESMVLELGTGTKIKILDKE